MKNLYLETERKRMNETIIEISRVTRDSNYSQYKRMSLRLVSKHVTQFQVFNEHFHFHEPHLLYQSFNQAPLKINEFNIRNKHRHGIPSLQSTHATRYSRQTFILSKKKNPTTTSKRRTKIHREKGLAYNSLSLKLNQRMFRIFQTERDREAET